MPVFFLNYFLLIAAKEGRAALGVGEVKAGPPVSRL